MCHELSSKNDQRLTRGPLETTGLCTPLRCPHPFAGAKPRASPVPWCARCIAASPYGIGLPSTGTWRPSAVRWSAPSATYRRLPRFLDEAAMASRREFNCLDAKAAPQTRGRCDAQTGRVSWRRCRQPLVCSPSSAEQLSSRLDSCLPRYRAVRRAHARHRLHAWARQRVRPVYRQALNAESSVAQVREVPGTAWVGQSGIRHQGLAAS